MAAAYAFHVAENQPFVDGNKRTAMACAILFLCNSHLDTLFPFAVALTGFQNESVSPDTGASAMEFKIAK